MRWCRFILEGRPSFGIVEKDCVIPVDGSPFGTFTKHKKSVSLESLDLLVPVLPQTFYAAGTNYMDHVERMAEMTGVPASTWEGLCQVLFATILVVPLLALARLAKVGRMPQLFPHQL